MKWRKGIAWVLGILGGAVLLIVAAGSSFLFLAHLVSAILVFGVRTVIAALTRLGSSPWPWKPQRWGWLIVGTLFLASALLVTVREQERLSEPSSFVLTEPPPARGSPASPSHPPASESASVAPSRLDPPEGREGAAGEWQEGSPRALRR